MSRGLGKSQREILLTLETHGPFYLAALTGGDFGARYKSLYRAACRLEECGQITFIKYTFGSPKLAVAPAGIATRVSATPAGPVEGFHIERDAIKTNSTKVSVEQVAACHQFNT